MTPREICVARLRALYGAENAHPRGDSFKSVALLASAGLLSPSADSLSRFSIKHTELHDEMMRKTILVKELVSSLDSATTVKGSALAILYPSGWIRTSHDVDILAFDTHDYWQVILRCLANGWYFDSLVCGQVQGQLKLCATFLNGRWIIDVTNCISHSGAETEALRFNVLRSNVLGSMLALVEELKQRPLDPRDLFDFSLLIDVAPEEDVQIFGNSLFELDLIPEWNRFRDAYLKHFDNKSCLPDRASTWRVFTSLLKRTFGRLGNRFSSAILRFFVDASDRRYPGLAGHTRALFLNRSIELFARHGGVFRMDWDPLQRSSQASNALEIAASTVTLSSPIGKFTWVP